MVRPPEAPPKNGTLLFVGLGPMFPPSANVSHLFQTQPVILTNMKATVDMHKRWRVRIENDGSCLRLLRKLPFPVSAETLRWFESDEGTNVNRVLSMPMYKSDLCRLASLYMHGGLYMDNDIELTRPIGLTLRSAALTANVDYTGRVLNNAILATRRAGHPLVKDQIVMFDAMCAGKAPIVKGWYGPDILSRAVRTRCGPFSTPAERRRLRESPYPCQVDLFNERVMHPRNPRMASTHRSSIGQCHLGLVDESLNNTAGVAIEPPGQWVLGDEGMVAFSRVKRYRHPLEPCDKRGYWSRPRAHLFNRTFASVRDALVRSRAGLVDGLLSEDPLR